MYLYTRTTNQRFRTEPLFPDVTPGCVPSTTIYQKFRYSAGLDTSPWTSLSSPSGPGTPGYYRNLPPPPSLETHLDDRSSTVRRPSVPLLLRPSVLVQGPFLVLGPPPTLRLSVSPTSYLQPVRCLRITPEPLSTVSTGLRTPPPRRSSSQVWTSRGT